MEEWKEYKLGEVCDFQEGYVNPPQGNPEYFDGDIKWLRATDLNDRYVYSTSRTLTQLGFKSAKKSAILFKPGTIVISKSGTIGRLGILQDYMCGNRAVINIIPHHTVNTFFVFFVLRNYQRYFPSMAVGSVQKNLYISILEDLIINLPDLNTQERIVSILKSLDDKIEVNRKINENLEQQAQALFKSWFVDFEPFKNGEFVESELGMIPKGWRVVSLDEMTSKFGTGLNPRKNFKLGEGDNYYVTIKNMGNNRVYLDDKCDKVTDEAIEKINKRSKLQAGDLLFSGIGTIGRVALITETPTNWNTSESVFNMHPADNISSEFLYVLLLSDVFQQYVKLHAQGGVQQGIRMASLKEYRMAIPEDSLLRKFDDIVMPIISRIKNNDNQSDSLASLRDTLLPKLMSGELKVNEIEI